MIYSHNALRISGGRNVSFAPSRRLIKPHDRPHRGYHVDSESAVPIGWRS